MSKIFGTLCTRVCEPESRFRKFSGFSNFLASPFPVFLTKISRFYELLSSRHLFLNQTDRACSHCDDTILDASIVELLTKD